MKHIRMTALLLALVLALGGTALAADFRDVPTDAYYADAVAWAAEKEIVKGRDENIFDPDAAVTRAEAVAFLWRMAGQPEPTQTETFTDVDRDSNNAWYKSAVQWAYEQEITYGTGSGQFSPTLTCTRAMILTMLYRMEGRPFDEAAVAEVPEDSETWTLEDMGNAMVQYFIETLRSEEGFTDVELGSWYELPVFWATVNGILTEHQVDADRRAVQPAAPCPRGEMVFFLYRASGEAPAEGAVKTGTIPETVLLDRDGVKITAAGIRPVGLGDAELTLRVENGSDKLLRVEAEKLFVNTYAVSPQVYIPTETEDGWTFYAAAVFAPGETGDCYLLLNSLDDKAIDTVYELELNLVLDEVEADEDGYYDYVDGFAAGEVVQIRTSLYEETASYDPEGTPLYDKDGLRVLLIRAENDEFEGPQITLYAYNGSGKDVSLELAELKLEGVTYEGTVNLDVPAGRRSMDTVYIFFDDYDNLPVVKEASLSLKALDPETWETVETYESVKLTFAE